jgi:hypothetical protein
MNTEFPTAPVFPRRTDFPRLVSIVVVALCAVAASAQLVPIGDDIAVSVPNGDYESFPSLAADRTGGWGVAWSANDLEFEKLSERQRRFDRDGSAVPGSLRTFDLESPDLALDGEGRGVVVGVHPRPELGGAQVDAICLNADGSPRGAAVRVDAGDINPGTRSPRDPSVAMDSDGSFVVAWTEFPQDSTIPPSVFFRRVGADCVPLGAVDSLGSVGVAGQREPTVAIRPDGGFALAWLEGLELADFQLRLQLFEEDGTPTGSASTVSAANRRVASPSLAVALDGTIAVVWRDAPQVISGESEVVARVFSGEGAPLGPAITIRPTREANVLSVAVASVGTAFVAAWGESGCFETCSGLYARAFDGIGALGAELNVNPDFGDSDSVEIAALGGAELVVVWTDWSEWTLPQDIVAQRIAFLAGGGGCVESSTTLCLEGGRFRVEIEWRNFLGVRGVGRTIDLTADSGLFWFFDADNVEVLVKMVDACGEFSRHWLFAAATTNVEYTLHVTDTWTGRSRSYFNALGRSSPAITDTDAFIDCP